MSTVAMEGPTILSQSRTSALNDSLRRGLPRSSTTPTKHRVRFSRLKVIAEIVEREEWRECHPQNSKVDQAEAIKELEALCTTDAEIELLEKTIVNTVWNRIISGRRSGTHPTNEDKNAGSPLSKRYEELTIEDDGDLRALRPRNRTAFSSVSMAFADQDISPRVEYPNDLVMKSIGSGRARLVVPVVVHRECTADVVVHGNTATPQASVGTVGEVAAGFQEMRSPTVPRVVQA